MQQIINFLIRNSILLLFVFLLTISVSITISAHSYHQSKFFNSTSWFTGTLYQNVTNISSYFDLREQNQKLVDENTILRKALFNSTDTTLLPSEITSDNFTYQVVSGAIIKNSFAMQDNYILINRGKRDSIAQDMGVITSKGILGIVENTSPKFATVQSILNTKSNINAKIKNMNYFGSLIWDAEEFNTVQLVDIPRLVPLTVGDTIVTGAQSSIFPENIPIGTIKDFALTPSKSGYTINIALFNDMSNVKNVYIITNKDRKEIETLATDN